MDRNIQVGRREHFGSIRCLVVDDNRVNRKLFVTMFDRLGVKARSVGSGEECLSLLRKSNFDMIFMDLEMPEMDGCDTTREIRRLERSTGLPRSRICALTGDVASGVKDRCLQAGMDAYLSKPIRIQDLTSELQKVAEKPDGTATTLAAS